MFWVVIASLALLALWAAIRIARNRRSAPQPVSEERSSEAFGRSANTVSDVAELKNIAREWLVNWLIAVALAPIGQLVYRTLKRSPGWRKLSLDIAFALTVALVLYGVLVLVDRALNRREKSFSDIYGDSNT